MGGWAGRRRYRAQVCESVRALYLVRDLDITMRNNVMRNIGQPFNLAGDRTATPLANR